MKLYISTSNAKFNQWKAEVKKKYPEAKFQPTAAGAYAYVGKKLDAKMTNAVGSFNMTTDQSTIK